MAAWRPGLDGLFLRSVAAPTRATPARSPLQLPRPRRSRPPRFGRRGKARASVEKPECFYELLERMYPEATKLELFARRSRPGWSAWENEVEAA
jgi:hypothetical protein